ncbi:MAG: carbohydrate binding family 9 domain-containing protein [Cyclobacteriaceae bacterium]|nr:carbohydrate binding family 9 domain-containing protein [Cyclobacteriaceae bacterium]MDH4295295.1 carbohydrate binding family 9 domain-containing protein [Cyclobacteriaceae bacterium]MDH5250121.1 carbohydrate binding family 9 domain-containing protein [Cyclobacteriaceae bacterium]
MRILFVILFGFVSCPWLNAQKINEAYQLHIRQASAGIKIDGVMDEEDWLQAEVAADFFMVLPMDTSQARVKTEVRMTYDQQNLYIFATCFLFSPGRYFVESLRRDFAFVKNDNFLLFMDPFDDQTNGFAFGANAAGAQWDAMLFQGGSADLSWDNKWTSAVKKDDEKYVFEAAIPFKSIRYKKGIMKWGINFSRNDLRTTEKSSWAPVPRQFPTASLAYTGILVWDKPPPQTGSNISIIPYALGGVTKDYEAETAPTYRKEIGMDAKIAVTSSLNLDLTINPDFSQVDVDQQVTNLDRYELFFPERRQFFLENADLFANFGYATIRPFFSRRIGLGTPIEYGARFSGKLNKNWRIGIMDMQTAKVSNEYLPRQNFAVMALQRRVFARSNIGFIFINKQSINYELSEDPDAPVYSQYNRNLGLEYNLASSNNLWTGKTLFLKSFSPDKSGKDFTHAANLQYKNRRLLLSWQHEYVGENYNAEVGYVPRRKFVRINPQFGYLFFPKGKNILSHGPTLSTSYFFDDSFRKTDNTTFLSYMITFRKLNLLTGWVAHDYVKLLQPFDPTNSGLDSLAAGTEHAWNSFGINFTSKPQSLFTYLITSRYGGYYENGTRLNLGAEVGYRFQPYVSLAVTLNYNDIDLPQPWGRNSFWLIGPRLDVTMTNTLFFTAFAQYNEQQNNVNLNTRFQWRYRPASDLFIVYTDNYVPDTFGVKNRSLVLKFTYWWNI